MRLVMPIRWGQGWHPDPMMLPKIQHAGVRKQTGCPSSETSTLQSQVRLAGQSGQPHLGACEKGSGPGPNPDPSGPEVHFNKVPSHV